MNLYKFIKNLTREELKVISKSFRRNRGKTHQKPPTLVSKLFFLILDCPREDATDEILKAEMGEIKSLKRFQNIKSQLYGRILDKICSDNFINNTEIISDSRQAEVKVQKDFLKFKMLHFKRSPSEISMSLKILDDVISRAKEMELYHLLVEALTFKAQRLGNREGYKVYLEIEQEIELFKELENLKYLVNGFYYKYITNTELISSFSEEKLRNVLKDCIRTIEASKYTMLSANVQYFYKMLLLSYSQIENRHNDSVDICLDIITLLNNNACIYRTERKGFMWSELSRCHVQARQFDRAVSSAREARKYFNAGSLNYILNLENEFFANFYANNLDTAEEIIHDMLNEGERTKGKIRHDKYLFFLANVEFAKGNFSATKKLCNSSLKIMKDKPRWDLSIRYLKIMALIEAGNIETAQDAIRAMTEQVRRHNEKEKIEYAERNKYIVKLLIEYSNCGLADTSSERLDYLIKRLSYKDSVWSWSYFSYELIPVNKWIRSRLKTASEKIVRKRNIDKILRSNLP